MKVQRDPVKFQPVRITLEEPREINYLLDVLEYVVKPPRQIAPNLLPHPLVTSFSEELFRKLCKEAG